VLRRSKNDSVIGGVCGGLGAYFGIDPVVFRIVFVLLALAGASGVLIYIVGWIAIPEEGTDTSAISSAPRKTGEGHVPQLLIGAALVAVGAIILFDELLPGFDEFIWPLALIAIGVGLALTAVKR
jgi:phage shock protein C